MVMYAGGDCTHHRRRERHFLSVSTHHKKGVCRAIAKEVRTPGVFDRLSTHCRKRWEDLRRWARKTAEAQLGLTSQRGKGARRTLTPLSFRILEFRFRIMTLRALRSAGVRDSKEAPVSPARVPAPPAKAKNGPPPSKGKKGTPASKGKETQPASKGKKKTPAGRSKEAPPSAKGRKGYTTQAMALQASKAAGEGLEATSTPASTATCPAGSSTTASSSSPSGQPSEAADEGL
ncbi:hypothetical protein NDU88_006615 [Pleurodeles waltl]|uniref:Uncharacterized protein n=1 Tax=Pleurodeles waltl TaxID=8319 RepID=A0AAV7TY46_PLEWA|nr:hypothetical protein NDU88_006615 [Pleurodeles waltl]